MPTVATAASPTPGGGRLRRELQTLMRDRVVADMSGVWSSDPTARADAR